MNTVVLSGELDIIQVFFYCDSLAVVISRETGSSWITPSILIHHTGISVYCVHIFETSARILKSFEMQFS
jgi:hypothetical protein